MRENSGLGDWREKRIKKISDDLQIPEKDARRLYKKKLDFQNRGVFREDPKILDGGKCQWIERKQKNC